MSILIKILLVSHTIYIKVTEAFPNTNKTWRGFEFETFLDITTKVWQQPLMLVFGESSVQVAQNT